MCRAGEAAHNNPRYQSIDNLDAVVVALAEQGLDASDVDQFVLDGWWGEGESEFQVLSGATPITLKGAPYIEGHADGLLTSRDGAGLLLDGKSFPYRSYPHVTGHVAAAYCTSPFAKAGQPAFCLLWDVGTFPRLCYVELRGAQFVECLFPMIGQAYAAAGYHFGPYKQATRTNWDLGVAGKLMAYIALGSVDENIVTVFQELYEEHFGTNAELARPDSPDSALEAVHDYVDASAQRLKSKASEDVLASFHCFHERLLVREMARALQRHSRFPAHNITGGCALNIKWNSALRASGLFDAVWVPPFPNDSGSAIGAACSAVAADKGFVPLQWPVNSGPALQPSDVPTEWDAAPCSMSELATVLASNKPVIFFADRAELGPRALGSRSILAAATKARMKDHLNDIKLREHFRPVAPIMFGGSSPGHFQSWNAGPLHAL